MSFNQEDVLRVVKQHGPIIPNKVKQRLGAGDTTMINVYLSNLKQEGKIKFTHLKLGSSKFAYTPEQKPKLEELIQHLNQKDQRTANKLREEKVIRLQEQEALTRVGLQEIKDYAIPIKVSTGDKEEIFYRYFLTTPEEAQKKIRELLTPKQETPNEQPPKPTTQETTAQEETTKEPQEKPAPEQKTPNEPEEQEEKPEKKEAQKSLYKPPEPESELGETITNYCKENDIQIRTYNEVRKNSEIDLTLALPTAVGRITFYAKAKSKKNSNDGDLAAAILAAKTRMLPAMYLTTGDVTTKAKENPALQEITVVELGS